MTTRCSIGPRSEVVCKKDKSTNTLEHCARFIFENKNPVCDACSYHGACKQVQSFHKVDAALSAQM